MAWRAATFADVVILGGDVALYEALEPLAGKDALICLVGGQGYRGAARGRGPAAL
jgi:hypothetical protein